MLDKWTSSIPPMLIVIINDSHLRFDFFGNSECSSEDLIK